MQFHEIAGVISNSVRSIFYKATISHSYTKPCLLMANNCIVAVQKEPHMISVAFSSPTGKIPENWHWVLSCYDNRPISAIDLADFKNSFADFPSPNFKANFISSNANFTREAVDYALFNNIGLARISPLWFKNAVSAVTDSVYTTSPLELKHALCDKDFGQRRKLFYGITSDGRIEHLGSLENYLRIELLNFK